jgi:hypothetical protein
MAKNDPAKFKEIMVRWPTDRLEELETVSKSLGIRPTFFLKVEGMKALNALKLKKAA